MSHYIRYFILEFSIKQDAKASVIFGKVFVVNVMSEYEKKMYCVNFNRTM